MITSFEIDGFKSLRDFSIKFRKGMNILVGPNGSGKTNICQALGLISALAEDQLAEYLLTTAGGAKGAFTSCCSGFEGASRISAKFKGEADSYSKFKGDDKDRKIRIKYVYSCELELKEELEVSSESLVISALDPKSARFRQALSFTRTEDDKVLFTQHNKTLLGPVAFDQLSTRKKLLFRPPGGVKHSILQFAPGVSYHAYIVKGDLANAKVYNIDPHLSKMPSDILEPLEITSNGRRLANAIYKLEKNQNDTLQEINAFLQNICSEYREVTPVVADDHLSRSFAVTDSRGLKCPASSLSDGTVKIIAMLVALLGKKRNIVILEEPENYLHPWACKTFIEYLREQFEDAVCVMTTHSETILNSIRPSEIIVVENTDGRTSNRRIAGSGNLRKAIMNSGFGCGYHYVSGAFGGVPS